MTNKSGKDFELTALKIIKELNPSQDIQYDVDLIGKLSKQERQIDIITNPKDFDFLIFECKDHGRTIDLDNFSTFTQIIEDVGAKKAAMVSNSSYSKGVRNFAEAKGIELLHIIDSDNPKIKTRITLPARCKVTVLKNYSFGFSTSEHFDGISYGYPLVYKNKIYTAKGLLAHLWNDTNILNTMKGEYTFNPPNPKMVDMTGKKIKMDEIALNYIVEDIYYLGSVDLINTTGIYNVKNQTFQTKSITTKPITPEEIQTIWENVSEVKFKQEKSVFGLELIGMVKDN